MDIIGYIYSSNLFNRTRCCTRFPCITSRLHISKMRTNSRVCLLYTLQQGFSTAELVKIRLELK